MINTKGMVPKTYNNSRDFQVLNKLLDLSVNIPKSDINNLNRIFDPKMCPEHMLPLLASYVGYEYDYNESVYANRLIIEYFPLLIRHRGSEIGISLALAIAINAADDFNDLEMTSLFSIDYIKEEGLINLYVYSKNYIKKIDYLLNIAKPVGLKYELINSEPLYSVDKISFTDVWDKYKEYYPNSNRYKVGSSVGFGQVSKNSEG